MYENVIYRNKTSLTSERNDFATKIQNYATY